MNFGPKSIKRSNLQITYYIRAYRLDEWEVYSFVIMQVNVYNTYQVVEWTWRERRMKTLISIVQLEDHITRVIFLMTVLTYE